MLLDEPSAYLDAENFAIIQNAIRQLANDRTTLIISHHVPALSWVNQVLLLENGNIRSVVPDQIENFSAISSLLPKWGQE